MFSAEYSIFFHGFRSVDAAVHRAAGEEGSSSGDKRLTV
jgi:hypothetical protein